MKNNGRLINQDAPRRTAKKRRKLPVAAFGQQVQPSVYSDENPAALSIDRRIHENVLNKYDCALQIACTCCIR